MKTWSSSHWMSSRSSGYPSGRPGADQDPQVLLEFLAGDAEPGGDLADVQALVVDQERDQLEHPLELVLGGAFAAALGRAGVSGRRWRDGGGGEVRGGGSRRRTAATSSGGATDHHAGAVGGELLAQRLGVPERHAQAVPAGVGRPPPGFRAVRPVRGGTRLRALAQAQQPALLDVHDGGPQRQLRQAGQFGADVEAGRRREGLLVQDGHGRGEAGEPEEALVAARSGRSRRGTTGRSGCPGPRAPRAVPPPCRCCRRGSGS